MLRSRCLYDLRMKLLLPAIVLVLSAVIANGQTEVANVRSPASKNAATTNVPVYRDYRGVTIGMSADEVRETESHQEGRAPGFADVFRA